MRRKLRSTFFALKVLRHFTVLYLVTRPMNASEAVGDPCFDTDRSAFSFKCQLVGIRTTFITQQKQ